MARTVAAFVPAFLVSLTLGTAGAGVVSGTYPGDGSASQVIAGLGFQPDVVIVKSDLSAGAVVRTATMGSSKEMTGSAAATAGYVLSLDPDGFTVGSGSRVNDLNVTYHWIAFETTPGESRADTYTGDGSDDRSITGLGFTPSYVMVIPEGGHPVYHRSAPMLASYSLDDTTGQPDHIQSLVADGFQIGSHADVNQGGETYHYVAWKAVAGRMAVGSYVGLANDNRAITGVGLRPAYVIVKADDNWSAAHKPASTGPATDQALMFTPQAGVTDHIQEVRADGFVVGRQDRVNSSGRDVFWMAWSASDTHLAISRDASTITIDTPEVRMVWDYNKGGGLHRFYAKTEANPDISRVGSDEWYNLFATSIYFGGWLREAQGLGPLELLEATATRARIRQKRDYLGDAHLERDWTVYADPRLGIRETLTFDVSLTLRGVTGIQPKGELTCSSANTFYCAGWSDGTNKYWLVADNGTTYSDMLAIPHSVGASPAPFFGRAGTSPGWESGCDEASLPHTYYARVREENTTPTSGTHTRSYLFHPHLDGLVSTGTQWQPYANDYRGPSALTFSRGSLWSDAAERTGTGDAYNEAEAAYALEMDPVTGLDFLIDGSTTTPRRRPFFKIRQWRSLQEPATVVLQGTELVSDRDFTADVKPVSYAAFCYNPTCTTPTPKRLARGGLVGDPDEYLADSSSPRNFQLAFSAIGTQYLYLGADSKFRGLNVDLATPGAGSADLKWEYYNGSTWVDLEAVNGFTDLTAHLTRDGTVFWRADPTGWSAASVFTGWPSLYYVRASLASGSYVIPPTESQIRTDILLFQYLGTLTAAGRRFVLATVTPTTWYRSIGTRPDYGTTLPEGLNTTVTATLGSTVVTGSAGTEWLTRNRGRGDRIRIDGVDYTVYAVTAENQLELTEPYAGASGSGKDYVIARKFASLADWEECIDGPGGPGCEGVTGASLADDNRSEVGIAYRDGPFAPGLEIQGSTTDASHTITLTADHGNRHYGRADTGGVARIQNNTAGPALQVRDDHVTVEWLEIRGGSGAGAHGVVVANDLAAVNAVVLDSLLVHDTPGSGIEILDSDAIADVYNNVVHEAGYGIRVNATPSGTSRIRLLSNTVFSCSGAGPSGIRSTAASNTAVTLRNNIAHGNNGGDFGVLSFNPASSHNLSSDTTGPAHSSTGGMQVVDASTIFVSVTAPDLHLLPASPAKDKGTDLSPIFTGDVDAGVRTGTWDIGADEVPFGAIDVAVGKDDGQPTAVPGGSVVYTITVRNNGPTAVTKLKLGDVLPPELENPIFQNATPGNYNSGTEEWAFSPALDAGSSASVTLTATVKPGARGTVANVATVEVLQPSGLVDLVPQNNSATDTDDLVPSADLSLAHADAPDPVDLGGVLTYTITVTNGGPSTATGVILTDVLPPEMEFDSAMPSEGTCSFDSPTSTLTCDLGDLLSGTKTVTVTARPRGLGTFTATATVTANETDPDSTDNEAVATTTVQVQSYAVRFLTVTSRTTENVIEWVNPSDAGFSSTDLVYRMDRFPTAPVESGTTWLATSADPGAKDSFTHTGLSDGTTYYYAAFVHRSMAPSLSAGRFVRGRTLDATTPQSIQWAFSTGGFSVTPPTVGGAGVIATSNDRAVHAMARGSLGGEWPKGTIQSDDWHPFEVGGPVQSRSPVIPIAFGEVNPVLFLGAQDGHVYALDAMRGGNALSPWPFASPVSSGKPVQAAPAGLFVEYGGAYDYLLVGTRDGAADDVFAAIDPEDGAVLATFDNGGLGSGIGIISGMATVDYGSPPHVYFTSRERDLGSKSTLWCLELTAEPTVFATCDGWSSPALGNIDGSPVIRGGRIYVGSDAGGGTIYSVDAAKGDVYRSFNHGDGQVKGFVFPDRDSDDIYFATENRVWGFTDAAASGLTEKWVGGISLGTGVRPSAVLFLRGTPYLYAGGSDGKLYEIDVSGPTVKSLLLGDGLSVVGAPSYDLDHGLVHVGTEAGVFYAVSVPLP